MQYVANIFTIIEIYTHSGTLSERVKLYYEHKLNFRRKKYMRKIILIIMATAFLLGGFAGAVQAAEDRLLSSNTKFSEMKENRVVLTGFGEYEGLHFIPTGETAMYFKVIIDGVGDPMEFIIHELEKRGAAEINLRHKYVPDMDSDSSGMAVMPGDNVQIKLSVWKAPAGIEALRSPILGQYPTGN